MAGDYTRFTFDPNSDYSGVLKQQGRVDLDADFNELIEIIDRRWRSETIDVIGHGVVPRVPPGTPPALDPFLVIPTAVGAFDIGIGRMYVDGIQVENHGLAPLVYLPDLGEQRGTTPVPYSDQPYLPAPLPPLLAATPDTTDLVYIDVWQREVTVLEDPALREIALGGPDTTTRVQSVWQVRALQDAGEHGCGDALAVWDQIIAPSAGRLTTSALAPPASDDPCIISPSGGYRGLENRLYRVEIHSTGPIGGGAPAKFKWSRNNAHVASSVAAIPSTTTINVQQMGRDPVLRFTIGNFIEITDDFREFQGLAGHMAQVTALDDANRLITFAPAIPGAMNFNAADPTRHTRVRRWDQTQNVDANGLLDVAAGPIDVEDGVRVTFALEPAGGNFRIGDYWVFAARTADGSVEPLTSAPPRGILHHYARLGFIHWGADIGTTTFTDCRVHWPPEGECDCCTVTVGDGVDSHGQFTDIQQAIDALGNRGGIVCIGRGFYRVTAGLQLDNTKRNVIIRGMGPATRIVFAPREGEPAVFMNIRGTEHVRLENVFVAAFNAEALIRISASHFCRVEDCILVNIPGRAGGNAPAARVIDFVEGGSHCVIARSALLAAKAVTATSGRLRELQVRDNLILALQTSILVRQADGLEIVHNQMRGLPREVVAANQELTRDNIDAFQLQISLLFRTPAAPGNFQAAGVVIFTGNRVVISQNLITAQVAILGFLFLNLRVHQNDIVSLVGALLIAGVRVKIEDNFVLGLLVGLLHAGVLVDLDCTANEWLGLHGIVWMSPVELAKIFAALLGFAATSSGLASGNAFSNAATLGTGLAGPLLPFGLILINKVHRNLFVTFSRGIYKTDSVVSADVTIIDNSFSICSAAAIELGGGGHSVLPLITLLRAVGLRHLIQGNAIAVTGKGIVSSTPVTEVEQNDVQCPQVAVELDAGLCAVHRNLLVGTSAPPAPPDAGLVILHGTAGRTTVTCNRLVSAPGHAILLRDDLRDLVIEDNTIEIARRFGIGTFTDVTSLRRSTIARNRIQQCAGEVAPGSLRFGGAVVIGASEDVRFVDNVVTLNTPLVPADPFVRWYAVYFEDTNGITVIGNRVTRNADHAGLGGLFGAVRLEGTRGLICLQSNVVRENGGRVLEIGESRAVAEQAQQALIQNNHFFAGPQRAPFAVRVDRIDSLLFQGNQCMEAAPSVVGLPAVMLRATRANVCGNVVAFGALIALRITGNELLVNGNSVRGGLFALQVAGFAFPLPALARVIVTSNLANGILANSTGQLIRVHNIPAP